MNKHTRLVVKWALRARPKASPQDLCNLMPALRGVDDDVMDRSLAPIRKARTQARLTRERPDA